jgi:glucan phosphoethanolaminetransferase (alkaline phosphatase superfamily)
MKREGVNHLMKRKLLAATFTSITLLVGFALILALYDSSSYSTFFLSFFFLSLWIVPIIIIYGLPVSFLSEKLTKNLSKFWRITTAFVIHVSFGAGFIFIYGALFENNVNIFHEFNEFWEIYEELIIPSLISAGVFWIYDEVIRHTHFIQQTN